MFKIDARLLENDPKPSKCHLDRVSNQLYKYVHKHTTHTMENYQSTADTADDAFSGGSNSTWAINHPQR